MKILMIFYFPMENFIDGKSQKNENKGVLCRSADIRKSIRYGKIFDRLFLRIQGSLRSNLNFKLWKTIFIFVVMEKLWKCRTD